MGSSGSDAILHGSNNLRDFRTTMWFLLEETQETFTNSNSADERDKRYVYVNLGPFLLFFTIRGFLKPL